jgi:hypothetical protein
MYEIVLSKKEDPKSSSRSRERSGAGGEDMNTSSEDTYNYRKCRLIRMNVFWFDEPWKAGVAWAKILFISVYLRWNLAGILW